MTSRRLHDDDRSGQPERPLRAAEYVRMSTDHQKYSTENQSDAIKQYAEARGIEIVRTYADAGKSGLKIEGRDALRQLIEDVQSGSTDFTLVLVYDVSRWGRFQDADESAYYEYICRRAGIAVEYCAEQFDNDGSPISTIVKGVKRAMAGEYSRELSTKVFAGQGRLIEKGYRQGGPAGFGLRRTLIDEHGATKGLLERGEQKSIQTDRVILTLGPAEEVDLVRGIYRAFVHQGYSEREIAADLNERGIPTDLGRPWTRGTVHQILINEKYVGDNVWNRRSFKLKKKRVQNDPEMWIRAQDAFAAVVERELFEAARTIIGARSFRLSDEEMLQSLRKLYQQRGLLSGIVIDECDGMPSSSAYSSRFGSLLRAYSLVGFTPDRDYRYVEINRELRIARRTPRPIDLMREIGALRSRGYSDATIAEKIGVGASWVNMIASLLERGEERLVAAVETGLIPITLAMEISKAETEEAQNLLLDAYETGKLRGKKLAAVRRLLDMRMRSQRKGGLPVGRLGRKTSSRRMTAADLMQVYQREAEKQRLLVKKSDFTQIRLLFVVEALKDLLANDGFINLLRAEGLATMPRALKARVSGDDHG